MKSKKAQAEEAAEALRQQRVRRDANATAMRNEQLERDVRSDEKKAAQDSKRQQEIFTLEREKSDAALEQASSDYRAMERIEEARNQAQAARNHNHTLTLAQQTQSFDLLK